jgi:hypothetical protein
MDVVQYLLDRIKVNETGCFEWQKARDSYGYGVGLRMLAHRLSWITFRGPIPDGLCVLHRCDNPCCISPAHLFLGTRGDNNRDSKSKGRNSKGDRHWSRLYPELRPIGDRNGSRTRPERVATGDRHRSRTHPESLPRGEGHANSKLTDGDVREIRLLYARGLSQRAIAKKFRVMNTTVSKIVLRKAWKHVE